MAVIGTFAFSALMVIGMRSAPGAVAAVIMATTPAITAIGAVVFLHDHLSRWQSLAFGLAVAGAVLVNLGADSARGSGGSVLVGGALVFAAVCCEAAYSLLGKQLTADLTPVAIATAAAVITTVLVLPLAVWDAVHMSWSEPGSRTGWRSSGGEPERSRSGPGSGSKG